MVSGLGSVFPSCLQNVFSSDIVVWLGSIDIPLDTRYAGVLVGLMGAQWAYMVRLDSILHSLTSLSSMDSWYKHYHLIW